MSKTPVCDPHKREWRDGFGHFSEWVPFDVAANLETDRAELVELLQKIYAAHSAGDYIVPLMGDTRALLARLEADK